ncbi:hypothetical protein JXB02_02725 [Candidatus Woesearchaeota archaeon]|nr:hypothetical protein [Candidatus Woesearchaeota archaeon]
MAIKDLEARQGNVDIIVEVTDVGQVREFSKFGKSGRVANATAKDETGEIKLTLWNDDIDRVKPGCKVHITNGYVSEWQGEKQLGTGKFGQIEVLEAQETLPGAPAVKPAPASKPAPADEPDEGPDDDAGIDLEEEDIDDPDED